MNNREIESTTFDYESIKQSLIDFLKSTDEFGDFDYEGSAINTIVDLLSRNTTYNAYLANMLANESFLDSAQLRSSIVSHAQKLSYRPRSYTGSRTTGSIRVKPAVTDNLKPSIVMQEGFNLLSTAVDNTTYSFVTNDSYILTLNNETSEYESNDIAIFQGQYITNRYIYSGDKYEIPNERIDTSTLKVVVEDGGRFFFYDEAKAITELASDSLVYFLYENSKGRYELTFGNDILGKQPNSSAIVSLSYVTTEEQHGNGVTEFIPASVVNGYSNITFTSDQPAYGGADRETKEDIRFIAPKYYKAQGRALTKDDYSPIIKSEYPFVRSIITWGGEENTPPIYGTVFMSIISDEGSLVTRSVKEQIVDFVKDYNVGSITPEIVDPKSVGIDLNIRYKYDYRRTDKTFNQVSNELRSVINDFNEIYLNGFDRYFNKSLLVDKLMNTRGVETMFIDKMFKRRVDVLRFEGALYTVDFKNPIVKGTVYLENFTVDQNATGHKLYDNSEGDLILEYTLDSNQIKTSVGAVNYDTGVLEFTVRMIQQDNDITVYAEPNCENIYIDQNYYAFIDQLSFEPLQ